MRSIQSRNRNLGIQNAQLSAVATIRRASDRPSFGKWCASMGSAAHSEKPLRGWLEQLTLATRVVTTRVTGGALHALAMQRSERHSSPCRSAAR